MSNKFLTLVPLILFTNISSYDEQPPYLLEVDSHHTSVNEFDYNVLDKNYIHGILSELKANKERHLELTKNK